MRRDCDLDPLENGAVSTSGSAVAVTWMLAVAAGCFAEPAETNASADATLLAVRDLKIGSAVDRDAAVTRFRELEVGSDGRIYTAHPQEELIRVHDPNGRLLTTIGRAGEGPGEFRNLGPGESRRENANHGLPPWTGNENIEQGTEFVERGVDAASRIVVPGYLLETPPNEIREMIRPVVVITSCIALLACERPPAERPAVEFSGPPGSGEPNLVMLPGGDVALTWFEPRGEDRHALMLSVRSEGGWRDPVTVAEHREFFVNWADFPAFVAMDDGTWAVHWLEKSGPDTYAYHVKVVLSTDRGATWSAPVVPIETGARRSTGSSRWCPSKAVRRWCGWMGER